MRLADSKGIAQIQKMAYFGKTYLSRVFIKSSVFPFSIPIYSFFRQSYALTVLY